MSDSRKPNGFDPLRTFLMMEVRGGSVWVLGLVLTALFGVILFLPMGLGAESPLVPVIGTVLFAITLFGTWQALLAAGKDESGNRIIVLMCAALVMGLGMITHLSMLGLRSGRTVRTLIPLLEDMWNYDLLTAMAWEEGSWSGGYLVVFGLLSRIETFPLMSAIKLVNLTAVCLGALAVQRLYLKNGGGAAGSVLASGASILALTILLNAEYWGHCDAVFAAFTLWGLYLLLDRHPAWGCLLWGIAVAFKLQAAFLFPLLIPMYMDRKVSLRHLLLGFAAFAALHLPMVLDGQELIEIISRYNEQILTVAYEGAGLTDNAPGVYGLMNVASVREFSGMGLFLSLFLALLMAAFMVRRSPLSMTNWLDCALVLAFGLPLILPQMNVRMGYLAFLIALCTARDMKGIARAALIEMISLLGYMIAIFGSTVLPLIPLSLISIFLAVWMISTCLTRTGDASSALKEGAYAES